jgi:hypothetical protein
MKRLFAILLIALAFGSFARAETAGYKINNDVVNIAPPDYAPIIDATNFINRNLFQLQLFPLTTLPYDFSNVENFTNNNIMSSSPVGFRFDTVVTATGLRKRAKNFVNAGPAPSEANASISAGAKLLVNATNVINRGLLAVGNDGLISLQGDNINLDRGTIQVGNSATLNNSGQNDTYWGLGTNTFQPSVNLTAAAPFTPTHEVESLQSFYIGSDILYSYVNLQYFLYMFPPGITAVKNEVTWVTPTRTNRTVNIVFLYNTNSSITTRIRFQTNSFGTMATAKIEWRALSTNPVTGKIFTNLLYLTDTINTTGATNLVEDLPNGHPPQTYIPENFVFEQNPFGGDASFLFGSASGTTYTTPAYSYWGTNTAPDPNFASGPYSAYSARFSSFTVEPTPNLPGSAYGTLPQRMDIVADKNLSMNLARIEAANYVKFSSPNFQGSSNASIAVASTDISLGSTNGNMTVKNLLLPTIPRYTGDVNLYSMVWSNVIFFPLGNTSNTIPVQYNVLFVDTALQHLAAPQILSLGLTSTNLQVSDTLNVYSNLNIVADNLTILSNGGFNLLNPFDNWASSVPYLKTFTNNGSVTGVNALYLLGSGQAPDGSDLPYLALVNNGTIRAPGVTASSTYLENRGNITATTGAIQLDGSTVLLLASGTANQAILNAPNSDILVNAASLIISNQVIRSGRSISLSASASITDGFPSFTNHLSAGDGFNLLVKPPVGDLRYTVVTNSASIAQTVPNWWAGEDRGLTAAGFTNNAALGKLVLNGGTNSLFIYYPAGESNALYVGTLELRGYDTQTNSSGDLVGVQVEPGMKIYYTYLRINGTSVSPSLLDGKNGGAFNYVSGYTGPDIASLSQETTQTVYGYELDLKVASGEPAGSAVIVSWNTVAGATNKLYYKDSLVASEWQLLNSFVSSASGRVEYPDAVSPAGRVYRVQLDFPNP